MRLAQDSAGATENFIARKQIPAGTTENDNVKRIAAPPAKMHLGD
jgi:hypothetical protein